MVHPLNPDGLLTPEDKKAIDKVVQQIIEDKENGTNKVSEKIESDVEQLKAKLRQTRENLE